MDTLEGEFSLQKAAKKRINDPWLGNAIMLDYKSVADGIDTLVFEN